MSRSVAWHSGLFLVGCATAIDTGGAGRGVRPRRRADLQRRREEPGRGGRRLRRRQVPGLRAGARVRGELRLREPRLHEAGLRRADLQRRGAPDDSGVN